MMGTALIDLYSSNYNESTSRRSSNDGNGNTGTIIKNKKSIKESNNKKLPSIRNLLFDSNQNKIETKNYYALNDFASGGLLVNINEEEEKLIGKKEDLKLNEKRKRTNLEYKSSSDGYKVKPLISPTRSASNSMQILNNADIKLRQNSTTGHQIDFGKVIARFPMIYVGCKFLDKKYTLTMLPWLAADFRRELLPSHGGAKRERKKIWFEITDRCVLGLDREQYGHEQLNKSFTAENEKEAFSRMNALNEGYLFLHKNNWICKIQTQAHEENDPYSFIYLTRDFGCNFGQNNENKPYTLHVFECDEKQIVSIQ